MSEQQMELFERPNIVGFCGRAGAGKTFAATMLRLKHNYHLRKFAGPLKDMLRVIGLDTGHIEGSQKELPTPILCGKSPRYAMQTLGTEWGRNLIGERFWIECWRRSICEAGFPVVADDVRFANEADEIRALGGVVVRIEALDGTTPQGHPSEAQEFKADYLVINRKDDTFLPTLEKVLRLSEGWGGGTSWAKRNLESVLAHPSTPSEDELAEARKALERVQSRQGEDGKIGGNSSGTRPIR